jgi:conjugal transfer pilus assembly protein TraK
MVSLQINKIFIILGIIICFSSLSFAQNANVIPDMLNSIQNMKYELADAIKKAEEVQKNKQVQDNIINEQKNNIDNLKKEIVNKVDEVNKTNKVNNNLVDIKKDLNKASKKVNKVIKSSKEDVNKAITSVKDNSNIVKEAVKEEKNVSPLIVKEKVEEIKQDIKNIKSDLVQNDNSSNNPNKGDLNNKNESQNSAIFTVPIAIPKSKVELNKDQLEKEKVYKETNISNISINIEPQFVYSGGFKSVEVSVIDMNRIVCDAGNINFVTYSKEKEIEVTREGTNAFLKIVPVEVPEINEEKFEIKKVLKRNNFPRELYIDCAGTVFSLIAIPKDIPAQTIILKSEKANVEKAKEFETSSNYEKVIFELIQMAYNDSFPDGYKAKPFKFHQDFQEISLEGIKLYNGAKYRIYIVEITAKEAIHLHEASFIKYFPNIRAITIINPTLFYNTKTRLIVITSLS